VTTRDYLREHRHVPIVVALTLALSLGWFLLDGHTAFNPADEGFLWYGTEAVRRGEVPMRDFESYDPGRYVWTAAWSFLLGDGLLGLRLACVLFSCLGVTAGLLAARRVSSQWWFVSIVALLLCTWMQPRYKVFEQSIALMAIYAGVLLLERPTIRQHWWVGVFGGLCAFMGRNHGAYHVLAFALLITWISWGGGWQLWLRRCFAWGMGLLVGYLPQWLMFLFVPGFFRAYLPYLEAIFVSGTNMPRAVDWPWVITAELPRWIRISGIAEGWFYVALPVFLALAGFRLWQLRGRSTPGGAYLLVAAACVSLPYTHYVFSRPDLVHLAHGAPSMVLGAIALAFTVPRLGSAAAGAVAAVLALASLVANLSQTGAVAGWVTPERKYYSVEVRGEIISAVGYHAKVLLSAQKIANELARPDEAILFAPHFPGVYPAVERKSPTKQIYFVFPASRETDESLVEQMESANLKWALVQDYALDNRDELRFARTNPRVFEYLRQNFGRVEFPGLPGNLVLLRRATATAHSATAERR
jgi:hypothetical protein